MKDAMSLLDSFLGQSGNSRATGADQQGSSGLDTIKGMMSGPGGLATGAVAGGLIGLLMGGKKPKKLAKSAMKLGGAALVGGLAYKAYKDWQANKTPQTGPAEDVPALEAPQDTAFMPDSADAQDGLCRSLVMAMIAAAKADGHVTDEERLRISQQLIVSDLDGQHRAFVEEELAKPLDIDAVASQATSPEHAAEIYAASLLVIDGSGPAERGYLAMLAARLNLDPKLVEHLHANTGTPVHEAVG